MAEGSPTSVVHLSIIRWIANNFYLCEGCAVPRSLLYELYMESCSPDSKYHVNSATFGKLIRLVFPGLGTRRLGKRGNTRYHYAGIAIKENSPFYGRYCCLLSEKSYPSGNACSSGDAAGYMSTSQKPSTVALLADEYYSYCQDILHMVSSKELDKVKDCIVSFWRSLQPARIALMSLTDVCQLFKIYDRQLFKEMENILLHDFLQDIPSEHLLSIRSFCKNVEDWMLNALAGFPVLLHMSKSKEITLFKKRLGRKTDLSIIAKTMRTVFNSHSKVTVLQSDLRAVISEGFLDVPGKLFQTKFRNPEELQNNIELKCLKDLVPLLVPFTDIQVLFNCLSSNLQAFVIQPSRNSEEFRKVASHFQLRWNFLLTAISKTMTLKYSQSFEVMNCLMNSFWHGRNPTFHCKGFQPKEDSKVNGLSESLLALSKLQGSWHLFNLLLMDFVAHIFLSYIEEEEDESFEVTKQGESPVLCIYEPRHLWGYFAEEPPQANTPQTALIISMQSQSNVSPEF